MLRLAGAMAETVLSELAPDNSENLFCRLPAISSVFLPRRWRIRPSAPVRSLLAFAVRAPPRIDRASNLKVPFPGGRPISRAGSAGDHAVALSRSSNIVYQGAPAAASVIRRGQAKMPIYLAEGRRSRFPADQAVLYLRAETSSRCSPRKIILLKKKNVSVSSDCHDRQHVLVSRTAPAASHSGELKNHRFRCTPTPAVARVPRRTLRFVVTDEDVVSFRGLDAGLGGRLQSPSRRCPTKSPWSNIRASPATGLGGPRKSAAMPVNRKSGGQWCCQGKSPGQTVGLR